MKTVRFINFWKSSPAVQRGFFKPLLEQVYLDEIEIVSEPDQKVDLEIYSVFPPRGGIVRKALTHFDLTKRPAFDWFQISPEPNSKRQIWFTGENIRPPLHLDFDCYLSFDSELIDERNVYLPLWVLNINWFNQENVHGFAGSSPTQNQLLEPRIVDEANFQERKFCATFVGNTENMRLSAIKALESISKVDIFGRMSGIYVKEKIEIANLYKFILTFENFNTPGYVTEKLLEGQLTGAIPIYWGTDVFQYFNSNAYINFDNFESFQGLVNFVRDLSTDENRIFSMLSEPIMNKPFPIEDIVKKLKVSLLA